MWLIKSPSHYKALVGAGYELCCDVIEEDHLPHTHKIMAGESVLCEPIPFFFSPQNGILRSTTPLRGTTVLLQPKPKHASGMTPFHVVGVKLIFFGDITTKLGPILCSAWHWLQELPRFETLKYYKENKGKMPQQKPFHTSNQNNKEISFNKKHFWESVALYKDYIT